MATPDYSLLQSITDPKARAALRKIVEKIAAMETGVQDTQAQLAALPSGVTTDMVTQLMNARLASLGLLNAAIATPVIGTPPSATPAPLPVLPGPIPGGVVPGTPPTRAQVCGVNLTFQGLMVNTTQFGTLPWFEVALISLNAADRAVVYAAKHAMGDTHCVVVAAWDYGESGQPYGTGQTVPPGDLTGDFPTFKAIVQEVINNGFYPYVILGGDGGVAAANALMPQILGVLRAGTDLTPWCLFVVGFDSVFYGLFSPADVTAFGATFRALLPSGYLGIEFTAGVSHIGGGQADYAAGGGLQTYDVILSEFNGPSMDLGSSSWDSAWRQVNPGPGPNYRGNQIWQIAHRLLGPAYVIPADQPADADSPTPPWYLASGNPRGPYFPCAFEWVGEYNFVRGLETSDQVSRDRAYFRSLGYAYTG